MTSPSPLSRTLWPAATGSGRIAQQVNTTILWTDQFNPFEPLPFEPFTLKIHFPSSPERAEFVSVCEVILVKYLGLDLNIKTICVQLKSFEFETVSCKVSSLHWIW